MSSSSSEPTHLTSGSLFILPLFTDSQFSISRPLLALCLLPLIPVLEEQLPAKSEMTILKSLIGILVLSHFWYVVSFVFFTLAKTRQNQSQTNKTENK